jgi:hypothetical protein
MSLAHILGFPLFGCGGSTMPEPLKSEPVAPLANSIPKRVDAIECDGILYPSMKAYKKDLLVKKLRDLFKVHNYSWNSLNRSDVKYGMNKIIEEIANEPEKVIAILNEYLEAE